MANVAHLGNQLNWPTISLAQKTKAFRPVSFWLLGFEGLGWAITVTKKN
ncbi:uncharacterized protein G2W53_032194 [Senna tora]|uniref:Uncharacterized protein n=1 Tax=Senna tora TaxID=362788 RepID=A0A834W7G7_9FABA|nr:uncharacterized protein G2W53_032194 [Senna tora]